MPNERSAVGPFETATVLLGKAHDRIAELEMELALERSEKLRLRRLIRRVMGQLQPAHEAGVAQAIKPHEGDPDA